MSYSKYSDVKARWSDKKVACYGQGSELFRLPLNDSGLSYLDQNLTINGTTVAPTFVYEGKNATITDWTATVGSDLSIAGSGADPTVEQGTPLLDAADKSVLFNGGKSFASAETASGNVTTEDFVIELVFKHSPTQFMRFLNKRDSTGPGWDIYIGTGGTNIGILFEDSDGSGISSLNSSTPLLTSDGWYHALLFVDRSGGLSWYINGIYSYQSSLAANTKSLSNALPLRIGNRQNLGGPYNRNIAYAAMWQRADWLDTHLQAEVAQERFQKLVGLWPEVAKGTKYYYGSTGYDTRTSLAYLDKYEADGTKKLYLAGAGWPRLCHRKDVADTDVKGLLQETLATNLCLQSADLATTWALEDAGDSISANAVAAPNGLITMDGIVADTDDNAHGVSQDVTLTAASYTFSVFAKAGAKDWIELANSTVANCSAYFNLSTGALGTKGAGASDYGIEDWGNDIYRCWIVYTGTVAAHTHLLRPAHADTDNDFAGDGAAVSTYFLGAQVELGSAPTSYIATTTAAVTRAYDYLYYKADDGNWPTGTKVSVSGDVLKNDYSIANSYVWAVSDATSTPVFAGYVSTARVHRNVLSGLTGKSIGVTSTTMTDNEKTSLVLTVNDGIKAAAYENGTTATVDTDSDVAFPKPADGSDQINVGRYLSTTGQFNGLISNLVIRKKYDEEAP